MRLLLALFLLVISAFPVNAAWPNGRNTGVPVGTILTPFVGVLEVREAGAVVENLSVTGAIVILADNVTVRNTSVRSNTFLGIIVSEGVRNALIEHCDIIGNNTYVGGRKGVWLDGAVDATVRRNHIRRFEDGVYMSGSGHQILDNFIHNPSVNEGTNDPHFDGIQLHGGVTSDITIRGNAIILHDGANAAITTGTVQRVLIDRNRMHWGGYTVVIDGRFGAGTVENVSITNNRFGPHTVGYWTFERATPTLSGNVDDVDGEPIP